MHPGCRVSLFGARKGASEMAKKSRQSIGLFVSVKWKVDLKTPDEWRADYFLWGQTPPTPGLFRREYPIEGTEDERLAREALVRVLRSPEPLSRTLRSRLAELFDPQSAIAERQLVFTRRRKGRPPESRANKQVSNYVSRMEKAGGKEAAVAAAQEQFSLSRKEVYKKIRD
jgi:hypothetical protein